MEELPFDTTGQLPQDTDPKFAWARRNLNEKPVEINKAELNELLRVPGIGPKSAQAILISRKRNKITCIDGLKTFGVNINHVLPFIMLNGKRAGYQITFW
jgi:predicted DNA-binding helix-hairpin-helix protein